MKRKNVNITLGLLAVVAAFVMFVPLPYRVICPLELKPRDAEAVYVQVPGVLDKIGVKTGQKVTKDQELGQLQSIPLDMEINELEAKIAQDEVKIEVLEIQQSKLSNASAALALPACKNRWTPRRKRWLSDKQTATGSN